MNTSTGEKEQCQGDKRACVSHSWHMHIIDENVGISMVSLPPPSPPQMEQRDIAMGVSDDYGIDFINVPSLGCNFNINST